MFDEEQVRSYIKGFAFGPLFNELGWDNFGFQLELPLGISNARQYDVDGATYTLHPVAHKRGFQIFTCSPGAGNTIPPYATRMKIDRSLTKTAREHLIIYLDRELDDMPTTQMWQWVIREHDKPITARDVTYQRNQSATLLLDKLERLNFPLDIEEHLALTDVLERNRQAARADRVTKAFFNKFKEKHDEFQSFIKGIQDQGDHNWYASLMLNRLMFVYFIQKQGFLNDDRDYLRCRLKQVQTRYGKNQFYSFYRTFLLRLFHEGLGTPERNPEINALMGDIPYLNGGLFEQHRIEDDYRIEIADDAFERVLDFFDSYDWHLDTRLTANGDEINPDVLGYIFEKYINQKQMGAYYSKEDITGYITTNTIIPSLLETAQRNCSVAFHPDGTVWRLLRDDPDRYIHEAIRKDIETALPTDVAEGINDTSKRGGWNKLTTSKNGSHTETWREHVSRRQQYEVTWLKLVGGGVTTIHDLITLNLDIRQFAQDIVANCEGSDLLRALYDAVTGIRVLDPTCGSGAFLFAALNVLEPLYTACLNQMQRFADDADRLDRPHEHYYFRTVLKEADQHPNRSYFIHKAIIINNLYGVDMMQEAVEICKLRLFLELASHLQPKQQIEPLPDIDFNIRTGNALVGYTSKGAVERAAIAKFNIYGDADRIAHQAHLVDLRAQSFRELQIALGSDGGLMGVAKSELRAELKTLSNELDRYLAAEYGIVEEDDPEDYLTRFVKWRDSHQPFHWYSEFYGTMQRGGFDVIIGNPPWKEYAAVRKDYIVRDYATESCGNLHGICTERAMMLRSQHGWLSFIVQLPLASSPRMQSVRDVLRQGSELLLTIPFDDRPGKLFEGLQHCRSVIFVSQARHDADSLKLTIAGYQRWPTEARPDLFCRLELTRVTGASLYVGLFPKYKNATEERLFHKVVARSHQALTAVLKRWTTGVTPV